jgi:hypothetical protein
MLLIKQQIFRFINPLQYEIILFVALLFMSSCWTKYGGNYPDPCKTKVYGWSPLLESIAPYKLITTTPKQATTNAGKIYVYSNYILQVETGEGIHVIDNSDPNYPVKKGFIKVMACGEVEVKDGYIYTNNFNDLVTLQYDYSANTVKEISRIPGILQNLNTNYQRAEPPEKGYYRCDIPTDSVVKSWVMDSLIQCNSCYKN